MLTRVPFDEVRDRSAQEWKRERGGNCFRKEVLSIDEKALRKRRIVLL